MFVQIFMYYKFVGVYLYFFICLHGIHSQLYLYLIFCIIILKTCMEYSCLSEESLKDVLEFSAKKNQLNY